MYTVLWRENGVDKWDRLDTKEEVLELLETLKNNEDVCEYDVWIFSPDADDYATDYDGFLSDEAL